MISRGVDCILMNGIVFWTQTYTGLWMWYVCGVTWLRHEERL